jgi:hypothetical protein
MGVRGRLGRIIDGGASARAAADAVRAIEALTAELHALQHKVTALEVAQLDEFDSIRAAVAAATDDLVARVQAVDARAANHE